MGTKIRSYTKDPVTCARNFEYMFQLFIREQCNAYRRNS